MKVEIHKRPMILPKIHGKDDHDNQCEVDVWMYLDADDKIGQVVLETVVGTVEEGDALVRELEAAFKNVELVFEE